MSALLNLTHYTDQVKELRTSSFQHSVKRSQSKMGTFSIIILVLSTASLICGSFIKYEIKEIHSTLWTFQQSIAGKRLFFKLLSEVVTSSSF